MTRILIRDATAADIPLCLALDHHYETDHVWQTHIRQDDGWQIVFRSERLPRTLHGQHQPDPRRLTACLPDEQCFIVAQHSANAGVQPERAIAGYLVMRRDAGSDIAQIDEIAVTPDARRAGLGKRLAGVASTWAKEHHLKQIQVAVRTVNVPAITFFQAVGFTFCGFNDRTFSNREIAVFFSQSIR